MAAEAALSPAAIGYGAAALAYAVLAGLSLTRWRRGLAGLWFAPALCASALWAAWLAGRHAPTADAASVEFVLGTVRTGLWLLVLSRVLPSGGDPWLRLLRPAAIVAPVAVLIAGALAAVLADLGFVAQRSSLPVLAGGLALSLLGLVLIEQAIRNAPASDRWALKHVLLGIGAVLAFDLVLDASSTAFGALDAELWQARGGFHVLAAVILAVGCARLSAHRPAAMSSQGVVFYTGTFVAVGLLLLLIAFGGWYVRLAGGSWGAVLQALFVACAILALVAALFSSQVRAWLVVVLAKSFAPYRYDYRAEWLRLTDALASGDANRPLAERALKALIEKVHSPTGGLWQRDDAGQLVPVAGDLSTLPGNAVDAEAPWLRFLAEREWVLDLTTNLPPELNSLPLPAFLTGNPRAWLIVPLLQGRSLEGFVAAARPLAPSAALTWEDLDLLKATGRQVAAFLALERVALSLSQAQQFEAYNRFAAFMMHDLKNVAAQLELVVRNADQHRRNPQFVDDSVATVDNATRRISRMLEQFRREALPVAARRTDVAAVCRQVVERCAGQLPRPSFEAPAVPIEAMLDPDRLSHVVEHIVRNAQEATPPNGTVSVRVAAAGPSIEIEVIDTGSGMDAEFVRDRLFRPFESTKGSQGMGIGAYQTREFARAAGGTVYVSSTPGHGTRFRIELPAAARHGGTSG